MLRDTRPQVASLVQYTKSHSMDMIKGKNEQNQAWIYVTD